MVEFFTHNEIVEVQSLLDSYLYIFCLMNNNKHFLNLLIAIKTNRNNKPSMIKIKYSNFTKHINNGKN